MQAYHQQIANLGLPNGTPGLLIASPSQFANLQQQQSHQQQYHHQPSYQELVKAYLPQLNTLSTNGLTSLSTSPASSSPSSSLSSSSSSSMASFAVRLMSLNAHELKCLNADNELMRHIREAQVLIDNRLHDINVKSVANQACHSKQQHQLSQQQSSPNQLNLNLALAQQQHQEQQIQQLQHQQHILMSPDNYYQNYYAQQLAFNQMAQLQQQQILSMDPGFNFRGSQSSDLRSLSGSDLRNNIGQQQHSNLNTLPSSSNSEKSSGNLVASNQQKQLSVPALDLRTTPTRPVSETPSPTSMGTESAKNSRQLSQQQQNLKKSTKLTECYRKKQKQQPFDRANGEEDQASKNNGEEQSNNNNNSNSNSNCTDNNDDNNQTRYQDTSANKTPTLLVSNEKSPEQTHSKRLQPLSQRQPNKRLKQDDELHQDSSTLNFNIVPTRSSRLQTSQNGKLATVGNNLPMPTAKKHKGEFDEPNAAEVAERERQLSRPDHYHCSALKTGSCACIIGSEFTVKTPREALQQLEEWRSLDIEQRIKWKWDLNDLPRDIPLSDIKKFEDLRRDYSNGRADFGGASKRKPLGIRGTRQFLLMLYCLWGHPGRDDPMQQDGYCPHCFAKIRTENEQSTLVRVVNHFNMKHRRGANPRLSPETRAATTTPQDHLICETLKKVVETAVASTES